MMPLTGSDSSGFGGPVRFAGGIKVRGIATMDYKAKNNEQLMQIPDAVEEESTIGVFSNAGAKGLPPAATKGTETVSQAGQNAQRLQRDGILLSSVKHQRQR
jgi:hypothetical protein